MEPRVIKRYNNRKLYDTVLSKYIKLNDIYRLVREGKEVRVIDQRTGRDITDITMTQVLIEEGKKRKNIFSISALKNLIRYGSGSISEIVEDIFAPDSLILSEVKGRGRKKLGKFQKWVDNKIEELLPKIAGFSSIKKDFKELKEKVEHLEKELDKISHSSSKPH